MLISVCIPAYNRPDELAALLESIATQECDGFEVVVSDDRSPRFSEIQSVVDRSREKYPQIPHTLCQNDRTLGYDANVRKLLSLARGDYCMFMGDDDLMLPGAIRRMRTVVENHDDLGVILRSYYSRDKATGKVRDVHRYFGQDRLFPAGVPSVVTFFRRSVFISGYTVHRASALAYDTDQFDGTLLYQLYLTANILLDKNGFYISDFLVIHLPSEVWQFGMAEPEKGRFEPGERHPEQCVNLIRGLLHIAKSVQETRGVGIYREILKDVDHYAYGPLTWQADSRRTLLRVVCGLWKLGLGRSVRFWASALAFLILGGRHAQVLARWLKASFGSSRLMGGYYKGLAISPEAAEKGSRRASATIIHPMEQAPPSASD
jgi:O-antigen biosynthesis alpha-1,2-rahmnosyltransferase